MSTAIQRRGGSTAQHASFTGLPREVTIDTTRNAPVVHDGVTAGGHPLATKAEVDAKLPSASYTAADVLAKLLTVDGNGSGLDADTLRGTTPGAGGLTLLASASVAAVLGALGYLVPPQGRLTLTSGTAVTASDVTAATSVFYTPAVGDQVPIYDGTAFNLTTFTELTAALTSNSGHTNYHQADKNFDLFVFNDSGTIRLGSGPAWSSDYLRGTGAGTTEIESYKGLWVNKNSITLRFGSASGNTVAVSARSATYVGTIRCTANGQVEDSKTKRMVWNAYNRSRRSMLAQDATDSWTYSTATWRQANGSSANQLDMVRGLDDDPVDIEVTSTVVNSTSSGRVVGAAIGVESTTTPAAECLRNRDLAFNSQYGVCLASYRACPGLGRRRLIWQEIGSGSDTQTWYGDAGGGPTQAGIGGIVLA